MNMTLRFASRLPVNIEGDAYITVAKTGRDVAISFNPNFEALAEIPVGASAFIRTADGGFAEVPASELGATDFSALRAPEAEIAEIPAIADRSNKVLGFNATGDPIVLGVGDAWPIASADLSDATDDGAALMTATLAEQRDLLGIPDPSIQESYLEAAKYGADVDAVSNTAALNAAVAAAVADGYSIIKFGAGTYKFTTKPNVLPWNIRLVGVSQSATVLERDYNEATAPNAFLHWSEPLTTGLGATGGGFENLSILSSAGKTGGIGVKGTTDGATCGYAVMKGVISYRTGGSWVKCLEIDGTLNDQVGGQGIRDIDFELDCFNASGGSYSALLKNIVGAKGLIRGFGYDNCPITITGGSASNEEMSTTNVIRVESIGTLTIDYAYGNVITGVVNALTLTANADASQSNPNVFVGKITTTLVDGSAAGTNFINSNKTTQTVASGQFAGKRNFLANATFFIDQRNAGAAINVTTTIGYVVDRWHVRTSTTASGTITAQRVTDSAGYHAIRLARSSGTYAGSVFVGQTLEESRIHALKSGGKVTLSVVASKGSGFTGSPLIGIVTSTTAGQGAGTVASGWSSATTQSTALSTLSPGALTASDQAYEITFTVPSGTKSLCWFFDSGNFSGSGSANDYCQFRFPQIEVGPFSSPFERGEPVADEDECRRFLYRFTPGAVGIIGQGYMTSTTNLRVQTPIGVAMRAGGTLTVTPSQCRTYTSNAQATPSAVTFVGVENTSLVLDATIAATTQFGLGMLAMTSGNAIQYEAEL